MAGYSCGYLSTGEGDHWPQNRAEFCMLGVEPVKLFAVYAQPFLGDVVVGADGFRQGPEAWAVVHVAQMGDLVGHDIFQHFARCEYQTP